VKLKKQEMKTSTENLQIRGPTPAGRSPWEMHRGHHKIAQSFKKEKRMRRKVVVSFGK